MRKSCFTTASCRGGTEKQMGSTTQGRTVRTRRRALVPAAARYNDRFAIADAFRARGMKFPPKGVHVGSLPPLRTSPARTLFGYFSGLAAAVRRQSSAAQGPAGGPAGSALAGRNHDAEEPHAHARGEALHRLRARGREAPGEQESVAAKHAHVALWHFGGAARCAANVQ